MGRPQLIPKIFYEYDFAKEVKRAPSAKLRMKLLALKKLQDGDYYSDVAETFQALESTVKSWMQRFVKEGVKGLEDKQGRGRKPKLSIDSYGAFKQAVLDLQATRPGGRINATDITEMAKAKFGVSYKVKGMYDVLHRLNLVWISSRSIHPAHNKDAQEAFKKTL